MRRVALLVGALALPLVPATPAYAATNNICVGAFVGTCDSTVATVQLALTAAGSDGVDSVVNIAPGTYADGPYFLNGSPSDALAVHGSGFSTIVTLAAAPSNDTYISMTGATLTDLLVQLEGDQSSNDSAITAYAGSVIDTVLVDGTATAAATGVFVTGSQMTFSSVNMGSSGGGTAMRSLGGNTVTSTSLAAPSAFTTTTTQSAPDVLSGLTIVATDVGVNVASGTVSIDDSLVSIGSGNGVALAAASGNAITTPKTLNADHVTVVGGGPGSEGVRARSVVANALQTSTVNLTNSVVRGPDTSLTAFASNNGSQSGPSVATVNVSHTAYEDLSNTVAPVTGSGGVVLGTGNTTADPQFSGPGDYHPVPGSPVIDAGNPAGGGPAVDLEGNDRVQDGNADGIDRRDMGAYELMDTVAPNTTFTGGPNGPTNDASPTFVFAGDQDATYSCQVDAAAATPCTSPVTVPGLTNGSHTVRVTATDTAGNVDVTPAERTFVVDTVSPRTKLIRKPGKVVSAPKAKFTFRSNESGATFQCRVDKKKFKKCLSPTKLVVKPGKHTFYVRAVDAAGNVDASAAKYAFIKVKPD